MILRAHPPPLFKLLSVTRGLAVESVRLVTVKMPEAYVEAIDELVRRGRFTSRSEAIRVAIRELLRRELWIKEMDDDEEDFTDDF